ncbi:hypothetical protein Patl1_36786 [Pistacia atlantica]|nr:hypothetical protein Patl1_36786 [Pistacia atlantica]
MKENIVLVVCGETGSGKTTQAISVAERVAYERCESSPGSDGSLVGYHVRLDSARNERTKLLFCTTGILLRKIAGDRNLTGITHVIADEVHERSLLVSVLYIPSNADVDNYWKSKDLYSSKLSDHGKPYP